MGGKHAPMLLIDPAIEKWNSMKENGSKNFRATPTNVRRFVIAYLVVPVIIYNIAEVYATKYVYNHAGLDTEIDRKPRDFYKNQQ